MKTDQTVKTRNYRKFYALLNQMHFASDDLKKSFKEKLVMQFNSNQTTHLEDMTELEYQEMLLSLQNKIESVKGKYPAYDTWRKRVFASIGAWLRMRNIEDNTVLIKSIACRAAKENDFNKIPLGKLRAIYAEFCNKNLVSIETKQIMADIENSLIIHN